MNAPYYQLTTRERNIILAALRVYQQALCPAVYGDKPGYMMANDVISIVSDAGHVPPTGEHIDKLCEEINTAPPVETADQCPKCKRRGCEVVGMSVTIEDHTAVQPCYCVECNAEWDLVFGLTEVKVHS